MIGYFLLIDLVVATPYHKIMWPMFDVDVEASYLEK